MLISFPVWFPVPTTPLPFHPSSTSPSCRGPGLIKMAPTSPPHLSGTAAATEWQSNSVVLCVITFPSHFPVINGIARPRRRLRDHLAMNTPRRTLSECRFTPANCSLITYGSGAWIPSERLGWMVVTDNARWFDFERLELGQVDWAILGDIADERPVWIMVRWADVFVCARLSHVAIIRVMMTLHQVRLVP